MEYQKIKTLLNNKVTQPSKFTTKSWVEITDDAHEIYNNNREVEFKTTVLSSNLCDCSDEYISVMKTITIKEAGADSAETKAGEIDKQVLFKNCAPFTA